MVWGAVCVCVQHVRCADRLCLGVLVYVCGGGPVCLCMHGVCGRIGVLLATNIIIVNNKQLKNTGQQLYMKKKNSMGCEGRTL